jgi:hypothetical protein
MTEQQWLACRDPGRLLSALHGLRGRCSATGQPSPNPECFRLFACACCRRLWHLLEFGDRYAVECLEIYAAGGPREALLKARRFHREAGNAASAGISGSYGADYATRMRAWAGGLASSAVWRATSGPPTKAAMAYEDSARAAGSWEAAEHWRPDQPAPPLNWNLSSANELAIQADLLRDIFGDPFRPVAFDPAWRTPMVRGLAEGIEQEQAFDRLPILADALEEAGCTSDALLSHCRSPGPHVRGCWALGLVLSRP